MNQMEHFLSTDTRENQEEFSPNLEEKEILIKDLESAGLNLGPEGPSTIFNQNCFDSCDASLHFDSLRVFNPTDALHEVSHCLSVVPPIQEDNTKLCSQEDVVNSIEDGFRWRKYGQKNLKDGKFCRSYYKCSEAECTVTKVVDQKLDRSVRKITYSDNHRHPKPQNIHRHTSRKSISEYKVTGEGVDLKSNGNVRIDAVPNQTQKLDLMESMATQDRVDAFTQGCLPSKDDEDGDGEESESESESERTRSYLGDSKLILRVEKHVDVLNDGYQWQKYGQKVLKGNKNPRRYYRCRNEGCSAKKYIRQDDDPKYVIAMHQGNHNHEIPVPKNSCDYNVGGGSSIQISHDPTYSEPSQGRAKIPKIEVLPLDSIPNFHHLKPGIGLPNVDYGMSSLGGCSSNSKPLPKVSGFLPVPPPPKDFFPIGSYTGPLPLPQFTIPPSMDLSPPILAQNFHRNHPIFGDRHGPSNNK